MIQCKYDLWIPNSFPIPPKIKINHNANICWVSQLIDQNSRDWEVQALKSVFDKEIQNIRRIPLPLTHGHDKLVWRFERHGHYTVRSGYYIARQLHRSSSNHGTAGSGPTSQGSFSSFWKKVWSIHLPPKLSIFLWSALQEKLPTNMLVQRCISSVSNLC